VLMGMTPKGYENMAANLQDIKRYIKQQKEIILYYREATGAESNNDKEDWVEKNNANQADQVEKAEIEATTPAPSVTETKSAFSIKSLIPGLSNE
jgi:type III secretory pathway component EscR